MKPEVIRVEPLSTYLENWKAPTCLRAPFPFRKGAFRSFLGHVFGGEFLDGVCIFR